MKTGYLWFDDDARTTLPEKIISAVTHYAHTGREVNTCYVSDPGELITVDTGAEGGVVTVKTGNVLDHHFLFTLEESTEGA